MTRQNFENKFFALFFTNILAENIEVLTKRVVIYVNTGFEKTKHDSIENVIMNKKCCTLFVLDPFPKALKCTPFALAKTAWATMSVLILALKQNFDKQFILYE